MRPFLLLVALAFLTAGCRRPGRAPGPGGAPTSGAWAAGSEAPCYNPFFPVAEGESFEYQSTGGGASPYTYKVTFSDISEGSFVRRQESSGGLAVETSWRCDRDGLISMEYGDLAMPQSRLKLDTQSSAGVTIPLPAKWQKGSKWDYGYQVTGQMTFNGAPRPVQVKGNISVANEVAAEESVTVPAGSFKTLKVLSIFTQKLEMPGAVNMPINYTFKVTSWYARDVGPVKTTSQEMKVTTELVSITTAQT